MLIFDNFVVSGVKAGPERSKRGHIEESSVVEHKALSIEPKYATIPASQASPESSSVHSIYSDFDMLLESHGCKIAKDGHITTLTGSR